LKPHEAIIEAMQKSISTMLYNGYAPTTGYKNARQAVADYYAGPEAPLTAEVQTQPQIRVKVKVFWGKGQIFPFRNDLFRM